MAHRRGPLVTALALNSVALVVEIGAGVPAKSLSLVMDGVHNLSDEVALASLVVAYSLRSGLSGRWLRAANVWNSLGLLAITALLGWQALERFREPQNVVGIVPIVGGLIATVANAGVAWVLRVPAADDTAIRLAYVHNLGDTLVSLGPVFAGLVVLTTGHSVVDPIVALLIAGAIAIPTVGVVVRGHEALIWPDNVACGHPPADAHPTDSARRTN
jgi:cobalt-zinc-cadmium efflux system protein